jgi:hypothetical protein
MISIAWRGALQGVVQLALAQCGRFGSRTRATETPGHRSAQTTKPGVRSSNLFGRATSVQNWAFQDLQFLRSTRRRACAAARFSTHDANFFRVHLDALGERAEVVAAVAAALRPHALPGLPGERLESLRCDARSEPIERTLGPLCVGAGLVAITLRLVTRSLSIGSETSTIPFSIASYFTSSGVCWLRPRRFGASTCLQWLTCCHLHGILFFRWHR